MRELVGAFAAAWAAFRFWIVNLPTLVRLTWFPLALLSLAGYGWHHWNGAARIAEIEAELAGAPYEPFYLPDHGMTEGIFLWCALQLIALAASAVAVHRFVLAGERQPGAYFAFAFGKAERAYFAMGVVAYALMAALVAGQYAAQLTMPPLDDYLLTSTMKPYVELGPFVLWLFVWPGELAVLDLPPLNYALWCALVIAAGAVAIRISLWPAAVAAEQRFALGHALAVTRGRALPVLAFSAAVALAAVAAALILSLGGLLSLVAAGPDQLGQVLKALISGADPREANVEIAGVLNQRALALYQEIARFVSGILGVTLGATLTGHLYKTLRA